MAGECSVAGCPQPSRKRGWCGSHYSQWYDTGEVRPFTRKWAPLGLACKVCGSPAEGVRRREFCSGACQALWSRHGGVPANPTCARCEQEIDLAIAGKGGRRKHSNAKLCSRCRATHKRRWMTPGELANRDGFNCAICHEPVDFTLTRPALMRPSSDHIIPRARGGSDDPSNFQLAHLWCNQVKNDRMPDLMERAG